MGVRKSYGEAGVKNEDSRAAGGGKIYVMSIMLRVRG